MRWSGRRIGAGGDHRGDAVVAALEHVGDVAVALVERGLDAGELEVELVRVDRQDAAR